MQLIQTTSILIQNINNDQESFYILSHPFLNKLISYNFDLDWNNELVDYFISFLKMLSLKIDKSTLQFFYNKKFWNFPLYGVAISLYNHKESMVRTGARAITLAIYTLWTEDMNDTLLSLPHATYFPNLACKLKYCWQKVDRLLNENLNIDEIRDEVEDINDLLEYFQDIYNTNNPKLTKALTNSLLIYAYYPCLLGSLWIKTANPEIISFQAQFFFLSQTFSTIKEPSLCNALAVGLFVSEIPSSIINWMKKESKKPKDYSESYWYKVTSFYLSDHIEENLSINSVNSIFNNQSLISEFSDSSKESMLTSLPHDEFYIQQETFESKKKRFTCLK